MYRLTTSLVIALTFVSGLGVLAQGSHKLYYSTSYADPDLTLNQLACSGSPLANNYASISSLPPYPYVGGVHTVSSYDTSKCGACYAVTYQGKTVNILAIDAAQTGFVVTQKAMDSLTDGQAAWLGMVEVTATEVSPSACNMPSY